MTDLMTGLGDVKTRTAEALRATEADPGLGGAARQAVLDAHLAICILKTTV